MRGDAIGAGFDRGKCGAHGIGTQPSTRIAQGGDVIDIDAKAQRRGFGHGQTHSKLNSSCAGKSAKRVFTLDYPRIHLLGNDGLPGQARQ
jgi:hypothetical protein